jgi:hypothetical protein
MAVGLSRYELEIAARFEINRAQFRIGDADAITSRVLKNSLHLAAFL